MSRRRARGLLTGATVAALLAGCAGSAPGTTSGAASGSTSGAGSGSTSATPSGPASASASTSVTASASPAGTPVPSPSPSARPGAAPSAGDVTAATAGGLAGAVVVLDPGHNGGNGRHPEVVDRMVDIGVGRKACDTTGTQTASGYTEAAFTWDLAQRLATRLRAAGATVVLTRTGNDGAGPCISERAAIGNRAAARAGGGARVVGLSLHADGGPAGGYGFHVIEPGAVARNRAIVEPSHRLGTAVRDAFRAGTGEPLSTYTGTDGVTVRTDLGGLDLSLIPKVFVECGNMRNAADAARLHDPAWRDRAAKALAAALARYLAG